MSSTTYFEDSLYPVNQDNGRADRSLPPESIAVYVSNFFGDHQIYLRVENESDGIRNFHLTKEQALAFGDALKRVASRIGYDNT